MKVFFLLITATLTSLTAAEKQTSIQQFYGIGGHYSNNWIFEFRDIYTSSLLAILQTKIIDNGKALRLSIKASSPFIHGTQGLEHIRGSNLLTARVLKEIAQKRYPFELKNMDSEQATYKLTLREEIFPLRKILANGQIDYQAKSLLYPAEVYFEIPLKKGANAIRLYLSKILRLEVKCHSKPNNSFLSATLSTTSSSGETQPGPESLFRTSRQTVQQKIVDRHWKDKDFEGKWHKFSQSIKAQPNSTAAWVKFLFEKKEYLILEAHGMSTRNGFSKLDLGKRLIKAKAPNWARYLYWSKLHSMEHMNASTMTSIKDNKDFFLSWKKAQGIFVPPEAIFTKVDVSGMMAPIPNDRQLKVIRRKGALKIFTGNKQVAGDFYFQQLERAVRQLMSSKLYRTHQVEIISLLKRPEVKAQRLLLSSITLMFQHEVPHILILPMIDDKSLPPLNREYATLAYSYAPQSIIMPKLCSILKNTQHPGWSAAASRLGDLGNDFINTIRVDLKQLTDVQKNILAASLKRINEREFKLLELLKIKDDKQRRAYNYLKQALDLIDYAIEHDNAMKTPLKKWFEEKLKNTPLLKRKLTNALPRLAKSLKHFQYFQSLSK